MSWLEFRQLEVVNERPTQTFDKSLDNLVKFRSLIRPLKDIFSLVAPRARTLRVSGSFLDRQSAGCSSVLT